MSRSIYKQAFRPKAEILDSHPTTEVAIKNQPYSQVYYQVQTKGHSSQELRTVEYWIKEAPTYNPRTPYPAQDYTSQYTVLKIDGSLVNQNIPSGGQLDIRVRALIGNVIVIGDPNHIDLYNYFASFDFTGQASDWSKTLTIS